MVSRWSMTMRAWPHRSAWAANSWMRSARAWSSRGQGLPRMRLLWACAGDRLCCMVFSVDEVIAKGCLAWPALGSAWRCESASCGPGSPVGQASAAHHSGRWVEELEEVCRRVGLPGGGAQEFVPVEPLSVPADSTGAPAQNGQAAGSQLQPLHALDGDITGRG